MSAPVSDPWIPDAPLLCEVADSAICWTTGRDGKVRIRTGAGARYDWGGDEYCDPVAWAEVENLEEVPQAYAPASRQGGNWWS